MSGRARVPPGWSGRQRFGTKGSRGQGGTCDNRVSDPRPVLSAVGSGHALSRAGSRCDRWDGRRGVGPRRARGALLRCGRRPRARDERVRVEHRGPGRAVHGPGHGGDPRPASGPRRGRRAAGRQGTPHGPGSPVAAGPAVRGVVRGVAAERPDGRRDRRAARPGVSAAGVRQLRRRRRRARSDRAREPGGVPGRRARRDRQCPRARVRRGRARRRGDRGHPRLRVGQARLRCLAVRDRTVRATHRRRARRPAADPAAARPRPRGPRPGTHGPDGLRRVRPRRPARFAGQAGRVQPRLGQEAQRHPPGPGRPPPPDGGRRALRAVGVPRAGGPLGRAAAGPAGGPRARDRGRPPTVRTVDAGPARRPRAGRAARPAAERGRGHSRRPGPVPVRCARRDPGGREGHRRGRRGRDPVRLDPADRGSRGDGRHRRRPTARGGRGGPGRQPVPGVRRRRGAPRGR